MTVESSSEGGWPGGWVVSAAAGVISAVLARWLGGSGMASAVLIGLVVFVVFGVLLGMFWGQPAASGGHDVHGHGDHGHSDNGHDDSGHGEQEPAPVLAALAVVTVPVAKVVSATLPGVPTIAMAVTVVEATPVIVTTPVETAGVTVAEARPVGLSGPRDGKGDDLQLVEGIGPVLEKLCNEMGIFHFDQISAWDEGEIAWMDGNLKGFKGRVTRDKWVRQAKLIGSVGVEEFKRRAKTNDY